MGTDVLTDSLERNDIVGMQRWLAEHPPHEIADELSRIEPVKAVLLFRLLTKNEAVDVFEELDPPVQQKILDGLREQPFRDLVEAMDPDDRAELLGEAPAVFAQRVLAGLSPRERAMTAELLGYPPNSVGRFMSPEMVLLRQGLTVREALDKVRERGNDAETVYTLPVVDNARHLKGVLSLDQLVLANPTQPISEIMEADAPRANATDDAEAVARLLQEANLLNITIVDSEERVVGMLTFDDALELIETADTEDISRQSASAPWSGHYLSVGAFQLARSRAIWLLLLIVAATLTVNVLQLFESTLAEVTALALFIPLLVGTGGNAGAQAATAAVRALAVGEVRSSDVLRVAWRESRVGLLLGAMLAVVAFIVGSILVSVPIAATVGLSLILICAWAAAIGGTMPLLAKQVGIDPAVVSAPLVTTLVDATGLIMYFLIAHIVLNL